MSTIDALFDLAEMAERAVTMGVYVVRLEGTATDTAAFPNFTADELGPGQSKLLRRDMAQLHVDNGKITSVDPVTTVLLVSPNNLNGWNWYLHAMARRMWTASNVGPMLDRALGDPGLLWDTTGRFPHGQCLVIGPGKQDQTLGMAMGDTQRAVTVIAHAPNTKLVSHYERLLDKLAAKYRGLVNFCVYDDPRGQARASYASGFVLDQSIGFTRNVPVPPVGGLVAILPDGVPDVLLPERLSLTQSRADGQDAERVHAWVLQLATLTLLPGWPHTKPGEQHAENIQKQIGRVGQLDAAVLVAEDLYTQGQQLAATQKLLATAVEKGDGLYEASVRQRERIADLETTLDDLNTRFHKQRAIIEDFQTKADRWRASDVEALELQIEQLLEEKAAVEADNAFFVEYAGTLEQAGREKDETIRRLREQLQVQAYVAAPTDEPQEPFVEPPAKWAELAQRAPEEFNHLYFGPHAFDAALKKLGSDQRSGRWLATAWATLQALDAYAATKAGVREAGFTPGPTFSNFRAYLDERPVEGLPATLVQLTESRSVRQSPRFRGARIFLGPDNQPVFMEAHVEIGRGGSPAPRLHFHDDTDGASEKVWVGYLGPHLPNTLT